MPKDIEATTWLECQIFISGEWYWWLKDGLKMRPSDPSGNFLSIWKLWGQM